MNTRHVHRTNTLLVLGAIALSVLPLLTVRHSEFGGADGRAEALIGEIQPQYEPWFEPVIEPPGGETESLLFALQAALGAGLIGYGVGLYRGRRQRPDESTDEYRTDTSR